MLGALTAPLRLLGAGGIGKVASNFATNPVQTARGVLQATCYVVVASWIGFGFYGFYLALRKGEPQAERVFDTCGDNLLGETTTPGEETGADSSGATGDMADVSGSVDDWITDGLACAGVEDSTTNHSAMLTRINIENAQHDPLAIQQGYVDVNTYAPGAGGFEDNRARGLVQITPQTWESFAPDHLQPAKDWIFKPRANVCVSAIYSFEKYGFIPTWPGGY